MDWPDDFRQVIHDGDNSALLAMAEALTFLADARHLRFVTIRSAGAAAAAVVEELLQTNGQTCAARRKTSSTNSSHSIPTKYILNGLKFCSCRIRTPILTFEDADLGDNIEVFMHVEVNIGNFRLRDGHLARTVLRARVFSVATSNIGVTRGDVDPYDSSH